MNTIKKAQASDLQPHFPSLEKIQQELGRAKSIDDFFGKVGIFARLFADTLETMLEAELTEHLAMNGMRPRGAIRAIAATVSDQRSYAHRPAIPKFSSRVTAMASSPRSCSKSTGPARMSWKRRSSPWTAKACPRATSSTCSRRRTVSRSLLIRSAPSRIRCGRWWKPGRIGNWANSLNQLAIRFERRFLV